MITFVKYAVYPMKYDVFISYRREGGSEFARSVKAELERKNYSVFLDFDELKDGKFDERILEAIAEAPVFLFILSSHSLDRCVNEDDWVRKEIEHAYSLGKHIIPVNKDGDFGHLPEGLPEPLVTIFATNQYSDIMVGQLFSDSVNKMIKDRIHPVIHRFRWLKILLVAVCVLAVAGGFIVVRETKVKAALARYETLLSYADVLLRQEDSLSKATQCILDAEAIAEAWKSSRYGNDFGDRSEVARMRLEYKKDSFFVINKNHVDFYMSKYREEGGKDNKLEALKYIDKALALKNDYDLSTMRRILK